MKTFYYSLEQSEVIGSSYYDGWEYTETTSSDHGSNWKDAVKLFEVEEFDFSKWREGKKSTQMDEEE